MNKNADKILFLLAISLVFYPTTVEESLANHLKERLGDKLEKLNKYDLGMLGEAFGYGCPKFINPIKNMHDFKIMAFEKNIAEPINVQKEILIEKFKKIQNLNNISAVLKLYTKIPVVKAAKVFNTTVENLKEMLEVYKKRNETSFKNTPFESTIIKRFVKSSRQLDFRVENEMIIVDEIVQGQDYSKVFAKQIQKLDEMMKELESY